MNSSHEPTCYLQEKVKIAFFLHPRLLEEEAGKREELEQLHLHQQRALSQTEAEKQELVAEQVAKERQLNAAMFQLDKLEKERQEALEQYKVILKKEVILQDVKKKRVMTCFAFYYTHFQSSEWIVCNILLR